VGATGEKAIAPDVSKAVGW